MLFRRIAEVFLIAQDNGERSTPAAGFELLKIFTVFNRGLCRLNRYEISDFQAARKTEFSAYYKVFSLATLLIYYTLAIMQEENKKKRKKFQVFLTIPEDQPAAPDPHHRTRTTAQGQPPRRPWSYPGRVFNPG